MTRKKPLDNPVKIEAIEKTTGEIWYCEATGYGFNISNRKTSLMFHAFFDTELKKALEHFNSSSLAERFTFVAIDEKTGSEVKNIG